MKRETNTVWDFVSLHHVKGGARHFGLTIPSVSFEAPGHEYENYYDWTSMRKEKEMQFVEKTISHKKKRKTESKNQQIQVKIV